MGQYEKELNDLLERIESNIDIDHCKTVDERYKFALQCEPIDRPPLVIQSEFGKSLELPSPWDKYKYYDYGETFINPVAMLQNALLNCVVPGILLKDDNPLAIRNDHGTIQLASVLGGKWGMFENDYPWIDHFNSIEEIKKIVNVELPEIITGRGILSRSFETLKFYNEMLDRYPKCKKVIQISMPDLQGPIDTADQLWGSDIYYAFYENPELLNQLLSKVVDTTLSVERAFRQYTNDRLDPEFNTQHGYVIPGRILIRNDSSIMISPDMYAEFVRPHDARLLKQLGGGSIHFCGNGSHLIGKMLEIPDLKGLDFGQPDMMDICSIYPLCRQRKVAVTNLNPTREDLTDGAAQRAFPTGAVFVYCTSDYEDAKDVVFRYKRE